MSKYSQRLTIHIGLPKTATTTIQRTLYKNCSILSDLGIDYCPELCKLGKHSTAEGHHALPTFLCSPDSVHYKKIDESRIRSSFARPGELLISSEGFTQARKRHLQYMVDNWTLPEERRVVLVLRNELDRIRSQWMQAVKTGHQYLSLRDYYLQVYKPGRLTVKQRLAIWESFGFASCVLRYEDLKTHESDISRAFLENIYDVKISESVWKKVKDANISPSPEFVQSYQGILNLESWRWAKCWLERRHPRFRMLAHNMLSKSEALGLSIMRQPCEADLELIQQDLALLPSFDS